MKYKHDLLVIVVIVIVVIVMFIKHYDLEKMDVALGYFEDVGDLGMDDLSRPACSGIEYLKRVQKEASECPEIVIADYPRCNEVNEITNINEMTQPVSEISKLYVPMERSQLKTAAEFAYLRQKFIQLKTENVKATVSMPVKNDAQSWCAFCFGKTFSQSCYNIPSTEEIFDGGNPPLLSILCQVNQPLAVKLLEYHLTWLDVKGFSAGQGRWLFGLLLCLDKPTPPDILSLLRNISRKCLTFRASLASSDDELLPQLNLFVILVSKYFGQTDLSLI